MSRTRIFASSVAVAASALLLAACGMSAVSRHTSATTTTLPPPTLGTNPANGSTNVSPDTKLGVMVSNGRITSVTLSSPAGAVTGQVTASGQGWAPQDGLVPSTSYSGQVAYVGLNGQTHTAPWQFSTAAPQAELHTTSVNVSDGGEYGVGMPIIVKLNTPIDPSLHAALEQRMVVTSTPAVQGAWRWFANDEVHWRPAQYWPAHTQVQLHLNFAGFNAGNGVWGVDGRTVNFGIGDARVSLVNTATHQMSVSLNGQVVKTIPVSTGDAQYPTHSGIHVVNDRQQKVIMDSATVGIPRDSPNGYYETVYWDVRISNSGEFVHAAPWSVGAQGSTNVSHGCVNVSDADGEWFFNFSRVGDVVQVVGTPLELQPYNGYGDWQIPWEQWAN